MLIALLPLVRLNITRLTRIIANLFIYLFITLNHVQYITEYKRLTVSKADPTGFRSKFGHNIYKEFL